MEKALRTVFASSMLLFLGAFPFVTFADTLDNVAGGAAGGQEISYVSGNTSLNSNYNWYWGYKPGASHNVCSVTVQAEAIGAPTDSLKLDLYIGSTTMSFGANLTNGLTLIGSADATIQVRSSTPVATTFTFTPCQTVVGGYWYAFYLSRTLQSSGTDKYAINGSDTGGSTITGTATWVGDRIFKGTFHGNIWPTSFAAIEINGTENFGATAPSTTPTFAQSVINSIAGVTDANASSTATSKFPDFTNIPGFFADRVPWGYLFSIRDAYNAAATSSSGFADITINFASSSLSTTSRMYLPSSITVLSTSSVTYYLNGVALDAANTLLAAAGWVALIMYWFKRAQGL